MSHIGILIVIMIGSGVLGGVASYLSVDIDPDEKKPALKRVGLGLAAAFIVPLFLNMISSSILADAEKTPINYLVFAGFCIVAAFSSKSFITSISKNILDKIDSVEKKQHELASDLEPIITKETEPEPEAQSSLKNIEVNSDEKKILKALANPKFSRRYLRGIERETGIEDMDAVYCLISLREKGLVHSKKAKRLDIYWLTTIGREYIQSIYES